MFLKMSLMLILCLLLSINLQSYNVNAFLLAQPLGNGARRRSLALLSRHNGKGSSAIYDEVEKRISVELSDNLVRSLRRRTPTSSHSSPSHSSPALNLETDFYDPFTGLHSEGVWHNCLVGMASVKLAELQGQDNGHDHLMATLRIADSLWEHSWDGVSFQRRSWSGLWDHSRLEEGAHNPPEQANYYLASSEHRCIQHGAASLFWSKLIANPYLLSRDDENCYRCRAQHKLINKQFLHEYWDESTKKWRTVSKRQGGGMVTRKSASSGSQEAGVGVNTDATYYRAVDQAIGLLVCLEIMEDGDESISSIIRSTCQTLLSDFGYQNEQSVTYIGLDRNRNLWHDGWVGLALLSCAKKCPNCWPENSDPLHQVGLLLDRLQDDYIDAESGTMWHWPTSKKPDHEHGNVRYCGDNALWYAICRDWKEGPNRSHGSFWDFVHTLQANSNDGLVSVADVYSQVRLHPNTELAFLVLWLI